MIIYVKSITISARNVFCDEMLFTIHTYIYMFLFLYRDQNLQRLLLRLQINKNDQTDLEADPLKQLKQCAKPFSFTTILSLNTRNVKPQGKHWQHCRESSLVLKGWHFWVYRRQTYHSYQLKMSAFQEQGKSDVFSQISHNNIELSTSI